MKWLVPAILVAAVLAGTARAGGETKPTESPTAAQRATLTRALRLVGVPLLPGHRLVVAAPRPGVRAQFDRRTRIITLFLDPRDAAHRVAHDIAHELGHAWDARFLDDRARARYLRARGVPGARWWPSGPGDDYATGAGDFAEMFARCHTAAPEFRSRLGPAPADPCAALPRSAA